MLSNINKQVIDPILENEFNVLTSPQWAKLADLFQKTYNIIISPHYSIINRKKAFDEKIQEINVLNFEITLTAHQNLLNSEFLISQEILQNQNSNVVIKNLHLVAEKSVLDDIVTRTHYLEWLSHLSTNYVNNINSLQTIQNLFNRTKIQKIADNFIKNQQVNRWKLQYENGELWKIDDFITPSQLGIAIPNIAKDPAIKITYQISDLNWETGTVLIRVKIMEQNNLNQMQIQINVKGYMTLLEMGQLDVEKVVANLPKEFKTNYNEKFLLKDYTLDNIYSLSEVGLNFQNDPQINTEFLIEEILPLEGIIRGVLILNKHTYYQRIKIYISGFLKITKFLPLITKVLNQWTTPENAFDLKNQIHVEEEGWVTVTELNQALINEQIPAVIVHHLEWKPVGHDKQLSLPIIEIIDRKSILSQDFALEICGHQFEDIKLYFKNIDNKDFIGHFLKEEINFYVGSLNEKSQISKTSELFNIKDYVANKEEFLAKYSKILLKNITIDVEGWGYQAYSPHHEVLNKTIILNSDNLNVDIVVKHLGAESTQSEQQMWLLTKFAIIDDKFLITFKIKGQSFRKSKGLTVRLKWDYVLIK